MGPQLAGFRMERRALHVAVAQRENFRLRARCLDERIVRRNTAIVVQANALAGVIVQLLCALLVAFAWTIATITQGEEKITLPVEHNARAEMMCSAALGLQLEQNLHIGHARRVLRATQLATRELGTVQSALQSVI